MFVSRWSVLQMSTVDLLSALPSVLGRDVLVEWLSIESVALLDSAFCNKATRSHFLKLLSDSENVFRSPDSLTASFYIYAVLRRVHLFFLQINGYDFELDLIEKVLEVSGKCLVKVVIMHPQGNVSLAFYLVAKYCKNLECLVLNQCNPLDFSFRNILNGNPNLSELHMLDSSGLTPALLADTQCPKLKVMSLEGNRYDDNGLAAMLKASNFNLQALSLVNCSVGHAGVAAVGDLCPQLHTLFINNRRQISNALVELNRKCTHIRNLELSVVPLLAGDLQKIFAHLSELHMLRLNLCSTLVDADLAALGKTHGSHIVRLYIEECSGYTAPGLAALLKSCAKLRVLGLRSEASQLTPKVVECIKHTDLRSLYLSSPVSNEIIRAVWKHGNNLVNVGLQATTNLGTYDQLDSILKIARDCASLKMLFVNGVAPHLLAHLRRESGDVEIIANDFPVFTFLDCID